MCAELSWAQGQKPTVSSLCIWLKPDDNIQVLGLTEFTGINANGDKQERQRTFSQSTTSTPMNWLWTGEGASGNTYAFLFVEMSIGKFEYTSIEVNRLVARRELDNVGNRSSFLSEGSSCGLCTTSFGNNLPVFSFCSSVCRRVCS